MACFWRTAARITPRGTMPLHVGRGLCSDTQGPCQWSCHHPTFFGKRVQRVLGGQYNKMFSLKVTPGGRVVGEEVQSYPVFGKYRARTTERAVLITTTKVIPDLFGAVAPRTGCAGELARDSLLNVQIPEAPSQGSNRHQESALTRALGILMPSLQRPASGNL